MKYLISFALFLIIKSSSYASEQKFGMAKILYESTMIREYPQKFSDELNKLTPKESIAAQNLNNDCLKKLENSYISMDNALVKVGLEHPMVKTWVDSFVEKIIGYIKKYLERKYGGNQEDKLKKVIAGIYKDCKLTEIGCFHVDGNNENVYYDLLLNKTNEVGTIREKLFFAYQFMSGGQSKKQLSFQQVYSENTNSSIQVLNDGLFTYSNKYYNYRKNISSFESSRMPELTQNDYLIPFSSREKSTNIKSYTSGNRTYSVDDSYLDPFTQHAKKYALPYSTGISGTTSRFLTMANELGMIESEDDFKAPLFALATWMIDSKDHTFHEIMLGAKDFGINYNPGEESYGIFGPQVQDNIFNILQQNGQLKPKDIYEKCGQKECLTNNSVNVDMKFPQEDILTNSVPDLREKIRPSLGAVEKEQRRKREIIHQLSTILEKDQCFYTYQSLCKAIYYSGLQWEDIKNNKYLSQTRKLTVEDLESLINFHCFASNSTTNVQSNQMGIIPSIDSGGDGIYASSNIWDNARYWKNDDRNDLLNSILLKVCVHKGERFLNMHDPKIMVQLESKGITTTDVLNAQMDGFHTYNTREHKNSVNRWFVLKNRKEGAFHIEFPNEIGFSERLILLSQISRIKDKEKIETLLAKTNESSITYEYNLKTGKCHKMDGQKDIQFEEIDPSNENYSKCFPDISFGTVMLASKKYVKVFKQVPKGDFDCYEINSNGIIQSQVIFFDKDEFSKNCDPEDDYQNKFIGDSWNELFQDNKVRHTVSQDLIHIKSHESKQTTYKVLVPTEVASNYTVLTYFNEKDAFKKASENPYPLNLQMHLQSKSDAEKEFFQFMEFFTKDITTHKLVLIEGISKSKEELQERKRYVLNNLFSQEGNHDITHDRYYYSPPNNVVNIDNALLDDNGTKIMQYKPANQLMAFSSIKIIGDNFDDIKEKIRSLTDQGLRIIDELKESVEKELFPNIEEEDPGQFFKKIGHAKESLFGIYKGKYIRILFLTQSENEALEKREKLLPPSKN